MHACVGRGWWRWWLPQADDPCTFLSLDDTILNTITNYDAFHRSVTD